MEARRKRPLRHIAELTGFPTGYMRLLLKQVYKKQSVPGHVARMPRVLALDVLP